MEGESVTFKKIKRSVYISPMEETFIATLAGYFSESLNRGETCVVILTPTHSRQFNAALRAKKIDIHRAAAEGRYITINANKMLSLIQSSMTFDAMFYQKGIENVTALASGDGRPVRVLGEVVIVKRPVVGARFS